MSVPVGTVVCYLLRYPNVCTGWYCGMLPVKISQYMYQLVLWYVGGGVTSVYVRLCPVLFGFYETTDVVFGTLADIDGHWRTWTDIGGHRRTLADLDGH